MVTRTLGNSMPLPVAAADSPNNVLYEQVRFCAVTYRSIRPRTMWVLREFHLTENSPSRATVTQEPTR
jgi:hypothetical protein